MLQTTSSPHSAYILTSTAVRLSHSLGLDQPCDDFRISPAELEQRLNVFWIVYMMDKGICLRYGRPSTINDEDIAVDLPRWESDIDRCRSGRGKFYAFPSLARLDLLESKVHSELYSARSRSKSDEEKLTCIGKLNAELQDWKAALPIEVRPDHNIQCHDSSFLSVVLMHFSYYNCLSAIHRVPLHCGQEIMDSNIRNYSLNPRLNYSAGICTHAARAVIDMLDFFSHDASPERVNLIW